MILFDASSISAESASGGTMTWSHTCGTGPDTILIANILILGGGLSSITYNGVAMTLARKDVQSVVELSTYYLVAPATGANNIVINWAPGTAYGSGGGLSLFGAKQTGQPNASAVSGTNGNASQTSISTTVSPTVKGCWLVSNSTEALSRASCGWTPSPGIQFACHGAGNSSSYYPNWPASDVSITMTDSTSASNTKWQNAVAFAPDHFGYPVSIFNRQML